MSVWLPGKAAVHASQSKGSPTGSGGCASTVQLVKPGDPEGTEGGWWGGGGVVVVGGWGGLRGWRARAPGSSGSLGCG